MKVSTIATLLSIGLGALAAPTPVEAEVAAAASKYPKIPGYNQAQSDNAWAIIGQIKKEKFGKNDMVACKAAFATAITESNIYNYANDKVPESLEYAHDKERTKSDLDSVGIVQQRVKYYPIDQAMFPAKSAHLFFKKMKSIKGWEKAKTAKQVGDLCQDVQGTSCTDDIFWMLRLMVSLAQSRVIQSVIELTWTRPSGFARRPRSVDDSRLKGFDVIRTTTTTLRASDSFCLLPSFCLYPQTCPKTSLLEIKRIIDAHQTSNVFRTLNEPQSNNVRESSRVQMAVLTGGAASPSAYAFALKCISGL